MQTDKDGNQSDKASTTVLPKTVENPKIDAPTAGDPTITGKGVPGDTVTVYFDDGTEIGSAMVDANGDWTVDVSSYIDLKNGDNIYAVQTDEDGNQSEQVPTTVVPKEVGAPQVNAIISIQVMFSGTGTPGDTIKAYLDDGTVLGSVVVEADGTWEIHLADGVELTAGENIHFVQIDPAGNQSEEVIMTVTDM
ncbi:hypothetical protein HFC69_07525 [Pediococcus sp. EKM202D]|uniref:Ig-like domain-containing protein n=1 Tax=unclassified Pediococcus TaxID=554805 RepID=UPI00142D797E|nr:MULTISPECIES: Ig-like domain-containing protein [unclassified Pediococcus]KAF5438652.1 hypothetical protein HFC69_07525 [Pediococcus sp. EKM202D]KAF5438884.1 hypothetical protein HFC68_08080 [Pediococcus sp. EKM201D]